MKDDLCPKCKGAKEIVRMLKKPFYTTPFNIYKDRERIICPTCNGTGIDKQEESNSDEIRKVFEEENPKGMIDKYVVFNQDGYYELIEDVKDEVLNRWLNNRNKCFVNYKRGYKSRDKEIAELKEKLKIAEDALEYIKIQPMVATQAFPEQMALVASTALSKLKDKS